MGESKRRKQILGDSYGIPDINAQVANAWETINASIAKAKEKGSDCIVCQCCRNDKGFHYDAITKMQEEMKAWNCPVDTPMLVQMLPEGFKPSATKIFDGFISIWTNNPEHELWREIHVPLPDSLSTNI